MKYGPLKNRLVLAAVLCVFLSSITAQTPNSFKSDIDKLARSLKLPTLAVGVARGDSLIFFDGIGSASAETQVPITADHIFGVASVTKSFTSVVLQQLEAEGKLSLKDHIDKFPNRYFSKERWTVKTTLAHLVSQTSESRPEGSGFVYNGGKYNIIFNAFSAINPSVEGENITRPFTREIEHRILQPLSMSHTLVRYSEAEHSTLQKFVVTPYDFDYSNQTYKALKVDLSGLECGPGYGMLSSVNDLIKYSSALDKELLISTKRYQTITTSFYPGSPYGLGWFTTRFEGHDMYWAYGLGGNDAAIFLKIPSMNLTLIALSSCSLLNGSARLGFGNPLNSLLVCSFLRNFVLNQSALTPTHKDPIDVVKEVVERTNEAKSRIYIEETFAKVATTTLNPLSNEADKEESAALLAALVKAFPADPVWRSTTAFELISSSTHREVLKFSATISNRFSRNTAVHPGSLFFAGAINEKLGRIKEAVRLFQLLAEGDAYNEQGYKFDAMMKLAKHYATSDLTLSKHYLERLIRFKGYIMSQDDQYKEAIEMLRKAK